MAHPVPTRLGLVEERVRRPNLLQSRDQLPPVPRTGPVIRGRYRGKEGGILDPLLEVVEGRVRPDERLHLRVLGATVFVDPPLSGRA